MKLIPHHSIVIHCDGACRNNPGPAAWSAIIKQFEGKKLVRRWEVTGNDPGTSTNQRAELSAAIEGLRAVPNDYDGPIEIISDSKYLVDGMNLWISRWKIAGLYKRKNYDLWVSLDKLVSNKNVTFKWVRGHAGNVGNEEAHAMASLALFAI